jgi:hypothetical protein
MRLFTPAGRQRLLERQLVRAVASPGGDHHGALDAGEFSASSIDSGSAVRRGHLAGRAQGSARGIDRSPVATSSNALRPTCAPDRPSPPPHAVLHRVTERHSRPSPRVAGERQPGAAAPIAAPLTGLTTGLCAKMPSVIASSARQSTSGWFSRVRS